jgi:hypothetical protein
MKEYVLKRVLPIYRMRPEMSDFLAEIAVFEGTPIRRLFETLCSVNGRRQHGKDSFLVFFGRYKQHLFLCAIWRQVICLSSEKLGNSLQKNWSSKPMSFQKLTNFPCQLNVQTPILAIIQESTSPSILFFASSLLLHHFFFFIGIYTVLRAAHPLYDSFEWRMQGNSLLLTILSIFAVPWITLAFCILAPFFHSISNGMVADIGSLTSWLDGHVIRFGIGHKGLRKTWGSPHHKKLRALTFPF